MSDVAILVDVQNVYYTVMSQFKCHFNYREFWHRVTVDGSQIRSAVAYAIDRGDDRQRKFQNILSEIGFDVKLKPYIQRADGSAKGDWDVGIAVDALQAAAVVDRVVLLSGDGDFDLLATAVRTQYDVEFDVFGVEALTARSLIDAASRFTAIEGDLLLNPPDRP